MTNYKLNILWLDLFDFLTYSKKVKLLSLIDKNQDIRQEFMSNPKIKEILTNEEFSKMALCLHDEYLNIRLKKYQQSNIKTITFNDKEYPYMLKEISSPPLCLYCIGNLQLLNTFCLAVVGTRKPTEYGLVTTKQYVKELVDANITIVSGMASGVDTIAHKQAMAENGNTIAVLGGGFNYIYPACNSALFREITKNNLVISEFAPEIKPQTYYFPIRNRIIAGLSRGVLVTEAGEKSGALHTKNYAADYGREVFAIPGKITSPESEGTNSIIRECQSCLCTSVTEITDFLGVSNKKNEQNLAFQLDITEQTILNYILTDKKTYQEIADYTKLSTRELNTVLFNMQMKGVVEKLAGNAYISLIKL